MGCGGSRMDVLEPHYLESWTKDTESTWLASTDTDLPLSSIQSISSERSSSDMGFTSEKKTLTPAADIFEYGLPHPAQAYMTVCSSLSEASLNEEEAEPETPIHPSQDPVGPPRSVPHTEEMVSIAVTTQQSSRQRADIKQGSKMVETTMTQATTGNACQQYGEEEEEEEEKEEQQREPASAVR